MSEMMFVRIKAENFEAWKAIHVEQEANRQRFGMTTTALYCDEVDPNIALVQIELEDDTSARRWFESEEFRIANERVQATGTVEREVWIAGGMQS